MSISAGGYNFEVAALSPKATRGTQTSDTVSYVASNGGIVDPAAAADALLQHFKANHPESIPFLRIDAEHINPGLYADRVFRYPTTSNKAIPQLAKATENQLILLVSRTSNSDGSGKP